MLAKALEVRDCATFIPVLAVAMAASHPMCSPPWEAQTYLLRRSGYNTVYYEKPTIVLTRLRAKNDPANYDPFDWETQARTFPVAHKYIIDHWAELRDGDVVDVEYILNETIIPKVSERLESRR